jgi:hypothetical protein
VDGRRGGDAPTQEREAVEFNHLRLERAGADAVAAPSSEAAEAIARRGERAQPTNGDYVNETSRHEKAAQIRVG